jgi:hypothetical protein
MSWALGCNGDVQHEKVQEFVWDATKKITAAGKVVGKMVERRLTPTLPFFQVLPPDTFIYTKALEGLLR